MRTIAHISDIHFGKIDYRIANALAADLAKRPPTLLVASGDFTQRARWRQFSYAENFLVRLAEPQILVPGNHDIPLYDLVRRFFAPLRNYRHYLTPELLPTYRDQEIFVMGINTARSFTFSLGGFWKDGSISTEQLHDVESRMLELPKSLTKVIVTHHPFIPPPAQPRQRIVRNATRALGVMERSGVDLLLAGHLHTGYADDVRTHHTAVKRSILSIQAGTAASTRSRGEVNSYNWITIAPDEISVEVRAFDGENFATSRITKFIRTNDIWRTEQ